MCYLEASVTVQAAKELWQYETAAFSTLQKLAHLLSERNMPTSLRTTLLCLGIALLLSSSQTHAVTPASETINTGEEKRPLVQQNADADRAEILRIYETGAYAGVNEHALPTLGHASVRISTVGKSVVMNVNFADAVTQLNLKYAGVLPENNTDAHTIKLQEGDYLYFISADITSGAEAFMIETHDNRISLSFEDQMGRRINLRF